MILVSLFASVRLVSRVYLRDVHRIPSIKRLSHLPDIAFHGPRSCRKIVWPYQHQVELGAVPNGIEDAMLRWPEPDRRSGIPAQFLDARVVELPKLLEREGRAIRQVARLKWLGGFAQHL